MRIERFAGGPFDQNTFLLTCSETGVCVVVDPGGGTPELMKVLEKRGVAPKAILLTHSHLDHVDGIPYLISRWPDLPVRMHPLDRPLWDAVPQQAAMFGLPLPGALPTPVMDLAEGETLAFGETLRLEIRFAPGHAPGHVIFVHHGAGEVIAGDVIFAGSIGRTDLPGGDHTELIRSIHREVLSLEDEVRLHPGHGPSTTVGRERASNPFLQAAPPASLAYQGVSS